jgi:hypothetical protein
MDATRFDLTVTVSTDTRLAGAVRELVVYAAGYAGCGQAEAAAFGLRVEALVAASLEGAPGGGPVPVTVRRRDGPVEVVIDGRVLRLDV